MRSIVDLEDVAAGYLAEYCSLSSLYAWPHYDLDLNPGRLTATDLLAPALLSYPIKTAYVEQVLRVGDRPDSYELLNRALQTVIADPAAADMSFESIAAAQLGDRTMPGWGRVLEAIDAAQTCKGLTSVAVTKILHRKRPSLVPVNDTRLRDFYGVDGHRYAPLFERIHADVTEHRDLLDMWRTTYLLSNGQKMSRLRALDIVVWMHQRPSGS